MTANRVKETTKTTCPYCGVGCGVLVSRDDQDNVTVKGDPEHPANFGRLCSKGSALAETIDLDGRLLYPEIAGEKVSWDRALDTVSSGLSEIIEQHGPDAVAFYVSGQLLTEDYYVANKLMKGFIGSANIDTNSRLCMSSAVAGYKRAFGSDSVPCSYEDLEQANVIVLVGSNLAWCHPVIFQRITKAKQERPEMKVVVIDPRRTASCEIADLHLVLKPGSDASLFNGLLCYLDEHVKFDASYIQQYTDGVDAALSTAKNNSGDIEQLAVDCGLSVDELAQFFALFADNEKVVTLYSQGVNQSSSGTDKSNSIINCYLATGRIGQVGMGPFSITGQPNAMGGREVGGLSNQLAAHMELDNPAHHELVSRFWQTENLAKQAGTKAVDLFNDVASGKIKAVWVMATNPVVSMPDADKVKAALAQCDMVIVSDCEAKTDTTDCADIVLPALGWGEKSGTVTNSERRISRQKPFIPAPGEAKPDWWIISQVAQRMGFKSSFDYPNSAAIFREHAALSGFDNKGQRDFDISAFMVLSDQDYEQLEPIQWPVTDQAPNGTERLFEDHWFFTASGRAQFIAIEPRLPKQATSADYPLILNTGRVRDQWHTMTRTARSARLNSHTPEPTIEIHVDDAKQFDLEQGMLAKVTSRCGDVIVRVELSERQQGGQVFMPIHWNQQFASNARVDSLVAPWVDPVSGQPEFKHTPVKVEAYHPVWHGFILSRVPLEPSSEHYWVKVKGEEFWRYELAGEKAVTDPATWARKQLGKSREWLEYEDANLRRYRAAVVNEGRLQSVLILGPDHDLPSRSWLSQLFLEPELDDDTRQGLLSARPGAGVPDVGPIVCACFGVGENTIVSAIKEEQADTPDKLGACLKAGTNCGSCIPELKKLIASQ